MNTNPSPSPPSSVRRADADADVDVDVDVDDGIGSTSGSGTVGLRAGAGPGDGGCPYGITSPGVVGQGTGSLLSSAVAARAHERANANTTIPIPMLRFQRARNSSAERALTTSGRGDRWFRRDSARPAIRAPSHTVRTARDGGGGR